jgi:beta-galactosidase
LAKAQEQIVPIASLIVVALVRAPGYEGKSLDVRVYSRYDSVQLYLNDKLIGEKPTTRREQFKAAFSVPYAAGTLKTVGIQAGKKAQTTILKTAGAITGLRLTPDRATITADGEDLSFITVETVDSHGNFQPNGDLDVSFEVTGPAPWLLSPAAI